MTTEIKEESPAQEAPIEEQSPEEAKPSLEDIAARDFRLLIPRFFGKLDPLSRRQTHRVIKALIEYPLENERPKFSYPEEREAFYIGMQLFDCKFVLMRAVLELAQDSERMKAFKEEVEKLGKEDKPEESKEGESNG